MKYRTREALAGYLFLSPWLVFLAVFFMFAFVRAFYFSFTDFDLFRDPNWVGLRNYQRLFNHRDFILAVKHTFLYAAVVTTVQTIFALLLAFVLHQLTRARPFFRTAFYLPSITSSVVITLIFLWLFSRTGIVNFLVTPLYQHLPQIGAALVLAGVAYTSLVWSRRRAGRPTELLDPLLVLYAGATALLIILGANALEQLQTLAWAGANPLAGLVASTGVLYLLSRLLASRGRALQLWDPPALLLSATVGLVLTLRGGNLLDPLPGRLEISWYSDPRTVLWTIMLQNIWTTGPTFMIMFLAALQGVPRSLYEAASIDGADENQRFWYITVPILRPVIFLVVTLGSIGTMQVFDQIAVVGANTPIRYLITLAYFIYQNALGYGGTRIQMGFAAAGAVVLAAVIFFIVYIQRRVIDVEVQY
ncbi:MAG: sugar ABC transporter permease [Deinococcus sp.]|nr:sugar ABC transporter permease [Deinococcus sp.]